MPIIVKDFTFQDQTDTIYISVPLRNVHPSKVIIYSNSVYVKANYPPYFFELDLADQIDSVNSSASVGEGLILFELKKKETKLWPDGVAYLGQDRFERRKEGERLDLELQAQIKQNKLEEKREKERELVRAQIVVEREAREAVQALKEMEIQTAKDHISAWSKELKEREKFGQMNEIMEKTDSAIFDTGLSTITELTDDLDNTLERKAHNVESREEEEEEESDDDIDLDAIRKAVQKQVQGPQHAPPRRSASSQPSKISLHFTGRGSIPTTTARETEDAKWLTRIKLAKVMNSLKGGESSQSSLEVSQKGQSAREKGASFFKLGNYEGAVNAFSEALQYDSQDIIALSNRAAAYLKLEEPSKCILDCSKGLETIEREEEIIKNEIKQDDGCTDQRRKQKIKLFVRRGAAYAHLPSSDEADMVLAIKDYESALALEPDNQSIKLDLESLKPATATCPV